MANYKELAQYVKSITPELQDQDDRLVAEYAVESFPDQFKKEEFDWNEPVSTPIRVNRPTDVSLPSTTTVGQRFEEEQVPQVTPLSPEEVEAAALPTRDVSALEKPIYRLPEEIAAGAHRGLAAAGRFISQEQQKIAPITFDPEKTATKAQSTLQAAKVHGKASEILDPTWYKAGEIQDRIEAIRGKDPNLANSFEMGDISGASNILTFNAFLSGDETAKQQAMQAASEVKDIAGKRQISKKQRRGVLGKARNVLESTSEMLPMMGKGAALSAIPVVGPVLSTSMWAQQGAGDIITTLKEEGVDDETALAYGILGGIPYALVEQVQVGQVANTAVKKAISGSIKKRLLAVAKEKGIDFLKENAEEVLQSLITENTVVDALKASGSDISPEEINQRYRDIIGETLKESAGPLGVLSLLGLGGGAARTAIGGRGAKEAGTQITEAGDQEGAQGGGQGQVRLRDTGENRKTLAEEGITPAEFYTKIPRDQQDNFFNSLIESDQERVMNEIPPELEAEEAQFELQGGAVETEAGEALIEVPPQAEEEPAPKVEGIEKKIEAAKTSQERQRIVDEATDEELAGIVRRGKYKLPEVSTEISKEETEEIIGRSKEGEMLGGRKYRGGVQLPKKNKTLLLDKNEELEKKGKELEQGLEGVKYRAVNEGVRTATKIEPPRILFDDEYTGSTIAILPDDTKETLQKKIEATRKADPEAAAKGIAKKLNLKFIEKRTRIGEATGAGKYSTENTYVFRTEKGRPVTIKPGDTVEAVKSYLNKVGAKPKEVKVEKNKETLLKPEEPARIKLATKTQMESTRGDLSRYIKKGDTESEVGADTHNKILSLFDKAADYDIADAVGMDIKVTRQGMSDIKVGKTSEAATKIRETFAPNITHGQSVDEIYNEITMARDDEGRPMFAKKRIEKVARPAAEKKEILKVDTSPTEAQKEAGNYRKAHIKRDSLDISIENPKGSVRSGTDPQGKKWSQTINYDYGYIKGTTGADAYRTPDGTDQVDVFIKPNSPEGIPVYVVNQVDPATGKFDEHKVMVGFISEKEAKKAYLSNYEKGWKGLGSIVRLTQQRFKNWVYSSDTKNELKPVKPKIEDYDFNITESRYEEIDDGDEPTPEEEIDYRLANKYRADIDYAISEKDYTEADALYERYKKERTEELSYSRRKARSAKSGVPSGIPSSDRKKIGDVKNIGFFNDENGTRLTIEYTADSGKQERRVDTKNEKELSKEVGGELARRILTGEFSAGKEGNIDRGYIEGLLSGDEIRYAKKKDRDGSPQPKDTKLMALHNIREEDLIKADKAGGMPVPSIAVTTIPHKGFGPITLIADKEMVSPENTPVYSGDIYSPSTPSPTYKVDKKAQNLFNKKLYDSLWDNYGISYGGEIERRFNRGDKEGFESDAQYDHYVKSMYLADNGIVIDKPMSSEELRYEELVNDPGINNYLKKNKDEALLREDEDFISEMKLAIARIAKKKSRSAKSKELQQHRYDLWKNRYTEDFISDSGKINYGPLVSLVRDYNNLGRVRFDHSEFRKKIDFETNKTGENKYKKWVAEEADKIFHSPYIDKAGKPAYTLDNIVAAMTTATRGQEKTLAFGLNKAKSFAAKKFKSIEEIRSLKGKIKSNEEYVKAKEESEEKFFKLTDDLNSYYEYPNSFERLDDASRSLADYYKKSKTIGSMSTALRKNGYKDVPPSLVSRYKTFADEFLNDPVLYFEAKPQRAVGINEFAGAVIPKGTSREATDILNKNGVKYIEYDKSKDGDREDKVKNFESEKEIRFAKKEGKGGRAEYTEKADYGSPEEERLVTAIYRNSEKKPKPGVIEIVKGGPIQQKLAEIISQVTGKEVVWLRLKSGQLVKDIGFSIDGVSFPRSISPELANKIFIDTDTSRPVLWTAFHEFSHFVQNSKSLNDKFWKATELTEAGKVIVEKEGRNEIMADIMGEVMSEEKFWEELSKDNTTFRRFVAELQNILRKVSDTIKKVIAGKNKAEYNEYVQNIDSLRKEIQDIVKQYTGNTDYDVAENMAAAFKEETGQQAEKDQTKTEAFKKWFEGSKVVDETGNPKVVYHGTNRNFTVFGQGYAEGWGEGSYFTDNVEATEEFGDKIYPVYLSIKNPFIATGSAPNGAEDTKAFEDSRYSDVEDAFAEDGGLAGKIIRELGYDGIISKGSNNIQGFEYVVFSPNQIKSATGNTGEFDPDNPDIRFARKKKIEQETGISDPEIMSREYRAKEYEKIRNSLRRKLKYVAQGTLDTRADIELKIKTMDEMSAGTVKDAILTYANSVGLGPEGYRQVARMVNTYKTAADLRRAADIIDRKVEKQINSELMNRSVKAVAQTFLHLKRIQGKTRSTVDYEANRLLNDYIRGLMPNTTTILNADGKVIGSTSDPEEVKAILERNPDYTTRDENEVISQLVSKFTGEYGKSVKQGQGALSDFSREVIDFIDGKSKVVPDSVRKPIERIVKTGLAGKSSTDLLQVIRDLYAIKKTGRTAQMVVEAKRKVERDAVAEQITEEIKPGKSLTAAELTPKMQKKLKPGIIKKYAYGLMSAEQVIERLTGEKRSTFRRRVFDPMYTAAKKEITGKEKVDTFLKEAYGDEIPKLRKEPYLDVVVQKDDGTEITVPLTVEQAMHWYAYSINPHQREWLLASISSNRQAAEAQLDVVTNALDEKYKDMVRKQWSYYDNEQWQRMNPVYRREHNIDMPRSTNYMPLSGLGGAKSFVNDDVEMRNMARPSTQKGMTISRTDAVKAMKDYNYFDHIIKNMFEAEHYIAFNDAVRDVASLMSSDKIVKKIDQFSPEARKTLEDWINSMATGKVKNQDDGVSELVKKMAEIFSAFQLGGKATTWVLQGTALPRGMSQVQPKHALKATSEMLFSHKETASKIDELSPFMKTRVENWDMAVTEWMENEKMKNIFGEKDFGAGYRKVKDFTMHMIGYLDKQVAGAVWYGKYLEVLDKAGDVEEAVYEADRVVRETQQGGGMINSSKFERGSVYTRVLTQFMSENRKTLQMAYDYAQRFKDMDTKERAATMTMAFLVPSILGWLIQNGFKPDEPDEILNQSIRNITGGLPIIGEPAGLTGQYITDRAVEAATGLPRNRPWYQTRPDYSPAYASIFDSYAKLLQQPSAENAIELGLNFVPAGRQVNRTIDAGKIMLEEQEAVKVQEEFYKGKKVESPSTPIQKAKYFFYADRTINRNFYFIYNNKNSPDPRVRKEAIKRYGKLSAKERARFETFVVRQKKNRIEKKRKSKERLRKASGSM